MESIRLHFLLGKSDRKVDSWRHKIDKSKKRNSGCIEKEERNNKKEALLDRFSKDREY